MTSQIPNNYNLPEYEFTLSINLQIPIRIQPEVSLVPSTQGNKNYQVFDNKPLVIQTNINSPSPAVEVQTTKAIQQIVTEVILPENIQHQGGITPQVVATIISKEDKKEQETDNRKQVAVSSFPLSVPSSLSHHQGQNLQPILISNPTAEIINEKSPSKLPFIEPPRFLIQPKSPRQKTKMGRAMDMFNDGFAFMVNMTTTAMFLGKVANYSWE